MTQLTTVGREVDGFAVGIRVGFIVGCNEGITVGEPDGFLVGTNEGI